MDFTLKTYETLINALLSQKYKFLTIEEYFNQSDYNLNFRFVLMRHDVDRKPQNALRMAKLEADVLGVASIYIDEVGRGYPDDEGDFGLVYNYKSEQQENAIKKAIELIKEDNKSYYQNLAKQCVSNKIDMTAFTVWFIENYPESVKIMKENPDYQNRFK